MYLWQKRQDKKGAQIFALKKLKTAWAGKKWKGAMLKKGYRTSLRIKASFPIYHDQVRMQLFLNMRGEAHFLTLCRRQKISDLTRVIFSFIKMFQNQKIFRTLFRRASACARIFFAFITCLAVLGQVPLCVFVCTLSNSHVFSRSAQQTDSFVFPTCVFVCAWSSSFVFACFQCPCLSALSRTILCLRLPLNVPIPNWVQQWRTCHLENLKRTKYFTSNDADYVSLRPN